MVFRMTESKKDGRSAKVLRNRSVFAALFAALIAVTCFVSIPAGGLGVPVVLQNMMVLLAGAVLGGLNGATAILLFLIVGAIGVPVYSGGHGGIGILLGPTGGFLIGYLAGGFITGVILGVPSCIKNKSIGALIKITLAGLAGFIVIYVFGVPWLAKVIMSGGTTTFKDALLRALAGGMLPFIPGDMIKLALFVPIAFALRPIAARYINPEG
jgi:biotin transport system substrate-specific component